LAIDSDVIWAGFLTGTEKWNALADADLFVLPSHSENFGIAVVEAMAAAVPVVVSDQVGIHREIETANAGVAVARNADCLAESLIRLLNDPAGRRAMGVNGQRLAETRYSLEAVTRQLIGVYNGVMN